MEEGTGRKHITNKKPLAQRKSHLNPFPLSEEEEKDDKINLDYGDSDLVDMEAALREIVGNADRHSATVTAAAAADNYPRKNAANNKRNNFGDANDNDTIDSSLLLGDDTSRLFEALERRTGKTFPKNHQNEPTSSKPPAKNEPKLSPSSKKREDDFYQYVLTQLRHLSKLALEQTEVEALLAKEGEQQRIDAGKLSDYQFWRVVFERQRQIAQHLKKACDERCAALETQIALLHSQLTTANAASGNISPSMPYVSANDPFDLMVESKLNVLNAILSNSSGQQQQNGIQEQIPASPKSPNNSINGGNFVQYYQQPQQQQSYYQQQPVYYSMAAPANNAAPHKFF